MAVTEVVVAVTGMVVAVAEVVVAMAVVVVECSVTCNTDPHTLCYINNYVHGVLLLTWYPQVHDNGIAAGSA